MIIYPTIRNIFLERLSIIFPPTKDDIICKIPKKTMIMCVSSSFSFVIFKKSCFA